MASTEGLVWIGFNGEIYDFIELRAELEAKDYTFRSRSDTRAKLSRRDSALSRGG